MPDVLSIDERLSQLQRELEALRQVKTQEDYDEGARLHRMHNAPWVKGPYTHLQFEPYKYQEFPKMLYKPGHEAARRELEEALQISAVGLDDRDRRMAIEAAERSIRACQKIVRSEPELRIAMGQGWCLDLASAAEAVQTEQRAVELADAERAFDDRRMSGRAAEERDEAEEAADGFVPEIKAKPLPPKTRTVKKASQL